MTPPSPPAVESPDTVRTVPVRHPVVPSEQLLGGHKTVDIVHNGTVYRLQATRLGKLILTK